MNKENCGPAFPITRLGRDEEGMTLRDYFAAKAMEGYVSDHKWRCDMTPEETARSSYYIADAMLKARG